MVMRSHGRERKESSRTKLVMYGREGERERQRQRDFG